MARFYSGTTAPCPVSLAQYCAGTVAHFYSGIDTNGLIALFSSIASVFLGLGLDIDKDVIITPDINPAVRTATDLIQNACIVLAMVFYIFAGWAYLSRQEHIALIKKESGYQDPDLLGSSMRVFTPRKSSNSDDL